MGFLGCLIGDHDYKQTLPPGVKDRADLCYDKPTDRGLMNNTYLVCRHCGRRLVITPSGEAQVRLDMEARERQELRKGRTGDGEER